jgi:hypothetical protein
MKKLEVRKKRVEWCKWGAVVAVARADHSVLVENVVDVFERVFEQCGRCRKRISP